MACRTVSRSRLRPVCTFTSTFNLSRMAASTSRERAQWKHSFSLAGADTSPCGSGSAKVAAPARDDLLCHRRNGARQQPSALHGNPAAVEQVKKAWMDVPVLQNPSKQIRTCLRNAEHCAIPAKSECDPNLVRDFLDFERRWWRLARRYRYSEQPETFLKHNKKLPKEAVEILDELVSKTVKED